jgi:hypothetical protein
VILKPFDLRERINESFGIEGYKSFMPCPRVENDIPNIVKLKSINLIIE